MSVIPVDWSLLPKMTWIVDKEILNSQWVKITLIALLQYDNWISGECLLLGARLKWEMWYGSDTPHHGQKKDVWVTSAWNVIWAGIPVYCSAGRVCKHYSSVMSRSFVCGFLQLNFYPGHMEFNNTLLVSLHLAVSVSTWLKWNMDYSKYGTPPVWPLSLFFFSNISLLYSSIINPGILFTLPLFLLCFSFSLQAQRNQRNVQVSVCSMLSCPQFSSPSFPSWWKPSRESMP